RTDIGRRPGRRFLLIGGSMFERATMTTSEAARALALSEQRVRQLVAAGTLASTPTAHGALIHADSMEQLRAAREADEAARIAKRSGPQTMLGKALRKAI